MLRRFVPSLSPPHLILATARSASARHPLLRRALRLVLVGCVVSGVWSATGAVDTAREQWGDTIDVLVASGPLEPGDIVIPTVNVDVVAWPLMLAPDEALAELEPGTVVRRRVGPGEPLTSLDVGRHAGPRGLVDTDHSATHVPATADQRALLEVGDTVLVVVAGRTVAAGAVVAIGEESVAVAVPDHVVALVSDGVLNGDAALALAAAGSGSGSDSKNGSEND